MTTIALICEGITDQIIISRIIEEICRDDDIDINPLQPLRDATDQYTAPHGGWELVFEYCEEKINDCIDFNDYIVIQIDTDQCDHENFSVQLTENGGDRECLDVICDVEKILISKIGKDVYDKNKEKILFAVAFHSVESWILLILFNKNKVKNSFSHLKIELNRRDHGNINKDESSYTRISKLLKKKDIENASTSTNSIGKFVENLKKIPTVQEI